MGTAIAWGGELHQEAKISARQLKGKEPTGTTNTCSGQPRVLLQGAAALLFCKPLTGPKRCSPDPTASVAEPTSPGPEPALPRRAE